MRVIFSAVTAASIALTIAGLSLPRLGRLELGFPSSAIEAPIAASKSEAPLPKGLAPYASRIKAAAMANAIPASLLAAVIKRESAFDPAARSSAGAFGLAQFMPKTALGYNVDAADPHASIEACARMLRDMLDATDGNTGLALASYNWGIGNVKRWQAAGSKASRMPKETRAYVLAITGVAIPVWTGKVKKIGELVANVARSDFQSEMRRALAK